MATGGRRVFLQRNNPASAARCTGYVRYIVRRLAFSGGADNGSHRRPSHCIRRVRARPKRHRNAAILSGGTRDVFGIDPESFLRRALAVLSLSLFGHHVLYPFIVGCNTSSEISFFIQRCVLDPDHMSRTGPSCSHVHDVKEPVRTPSLPLLLNEKCLSPMESRLWECSVRKETTVRKNDAEHSLTLKALAKWDSALHTSPLSGQEFRLCCTTNPESK